LPAIKFNPLAPGFAYWGIPVPAYMRAFIRHNAGRLSLFRNKNWRFWLFRGGFVGWRLCAEAIAGKGPVILA